MNEVHTILAPTDFSDCSRCAFRLAATLARALGARLLVLHVRQAWGPLVSYGEILERLVPEEQQKKLWNILHQFRAPHGDVRVEHRMADGDAAREILRTADEVGADLIVLGTHGRSGLKRVLMGGVAEQVLRQARCPVLTVKTPAADAAGGEPGRRAQAVRVTQNE